MSLQSLAKDLGQIYNRLFDHSPAIQGEVGYFHSQFEEHARNKELDHLLQTSHLLNEAVETEVEERIRAAPIDKITTKLEVVAEMMERTVQKGKEGRYKNYVESIRKAQAEGLTEFETELTKKRAEVDIQCTEKLEELKTQFSNLQARNGLK